ncbi:MAG TPA: hypothetical protein VGX03_28295 [Candidatus Binatia bacterium]|nr:hypothetical protein [Candidatus Binatia bacterium]
MREKAEIVRTADPTRWRRRERQDESRRVRAGEASPRIRMSYI